jgi:hypothetical protein
MIHNITLLQNVDFETRLQAYVNPPPSILITSLKNRIVCIFKLNISCNETVELFFFKQFQRVQFFITL